MKKFLIRDIRARGADLVSCSKAEAEYLRDDPQDPTRKLQDPYGLHAALMSYV